MQDLQAYIWPLLWLAPLVLAIVNYIKAQAPGFPSWSLALVAIVVGMIVAAVVVYFPTMPEALRVIVAGAAIGGTAAGIFDIGKMIGGTAATTSDE